MTLPNRVYDILKWIVCLLLPACAVAITSLAEIYGFGEWAQQAALTIGVVQTFLGAIFCISAASYRQNGGQ